MKRLYNIVDNGMTRISFLENRPELELGSQNNTRPGVMVV